MVNKRNQLIDVLKGFAVLSVILGHSIQRGIGVGFEENIIYKIIFTYNMPLFMLLSGYTLYLSKKPYDIHFLILRFKRLIIPTVVFTYVFFLIEDFWFVGIKQFKDIPDNIIMFTKQFIISPDYLIWFLYIVFLCNVVFFIGKKLFNNYFKVYLIVVAILVHLIPIGAFGIFRLKLYLPIFIAGYLIAEYKDVIFKYLKYLFIPALIAWALYADLWEFDSPYLYQYLIAISSMIVIYYLLKSIKVEKINQTLVYLGQRSLEYYLLHILFLNIGIGEGALRIVTIFISALLVSTVLIHLIKKNKHTKALFFGEF